MIFSFIDKERGKHSVSLLCKVLEVSVSGYYAHLSRQPSLHYYQDMRYKVIIAQIFSANRCVYGVRRIQASLRCTALKKR